MEILEKPKSSGPSKKQIKLQFHFKKNKREYVRKESLFDLDAGNNLRVIQESGHWAHKGKYAVLAECLLV